MMHTNDMTMQKENINNQNNKELRNGRHKERKIPSQKRKGLQG